MKNKQITVENTNKRLRNKCAMTCFGDMNQNNFTNKVYSLFTTHHSLIHADKDFSRFTSHFSLKQAGATHVALCDSVGSYFRHWCGAFTLAEGATHVAHWNNSRKIAFTLAEVLITLGIIGIVAAMTMPALIANHRKTVLKTQFKKAYSELQQVNQNFIKDYDMNICEYNWQMWDETKSGYASSKATSDAFIKYYTGDRTSKSQILGSNQIKNLTGTKTVPQTLFDDGGAVDIQKRTFYFEYGVSNYKCPIISVDINGYYKRPNQLGVDIFSFRPTKDGKIIPIGNPQTINDQINGSAVLGNGHSCTCTKKETDSITNGVCCAYWASIDINPDDNSKAYWKSFIQ